MAEQQQGGGDVQKALQRLGPKARAKFKTVMREFANGNLTSSDGSKVESRSQAVAIALSEARRHGSS